MVTRCLDGGEIQLVLEFIATKIIGMAMVLMATEVLEACPRCLWPTSFLRQGDSTSTSQSCSCGHTMMRNKAGATDLRGDLSSTSAALGSLHFHAQAEGTHVVSYIPRSVFWYSWMGRS